jgi:hypothetical protein
MELTKAIIEAIQATNNIFDILFGFIKYEIINTTKINDKKLSNIIRKNKPIKRSK